MAGQKQTKAGEQATRSRGQAGRQQPRNGQQRSGQQQSGQQRSGQGRSVGRDGAAASGPTARDKARAARPSELAAAAAPPQQPGAPGWLRWTTLVLALAGLGLSIYLTIVHLTPSALFCSDKGVINCAAVTTSAQSKLFGVFPVAELGLAFYVFMVAITTPWAWRMRWPAVYWLRLGSVVAGMLFVLYLVYVELIQLHHICLYCTGVHVVTFLLFALLVFYAASKPVQEVAGSQASRI
jgi:uncharacterized membrane protein